MKLKFSNELSEKWSERQIICTGLVSFCLCNMANQMDQMQSVPASGKPIARAAATTTATLLTRAIESHFYRS